MNPRHLNYDELMNLDSDNEEFNRLREVVEARESDFERFSYYYNNHECITSEDDDDFSDDTNRY